MKIIKAQIEQLKTFPRNAKKHPDRHIETLVESIKEFGWKKPILISSDDFIIAGHGRVKAAKKMKLKTIPAIRDEKSAAELAAYNIADNKTTSTEYNEALLNESLRDLADQNFNLKALGFDQLEIEDRLLKFEIDTSADFGKYDDLVKGITQEPHQGTRTVTLRGPAEALTDKIITELKAKYVIAGIEVIE